MITDRVELVAGVGAFITSPEGQFLTIEELKTKRKTGKIRGMRSLPMETVEPGETFPQALRRLFEEELKVTDPEVAMLNRAELCVVQLNEGIWLHAYLLEASKKFSCEIGSAFDEIASPLWLDIGEVLNEDRGSLRFRPGVREVVDSYREFKADRNFNTKVFFNTANRVPDMVFDLLAAGVSRNEALSRAGLMSEASL